MKTIIQAMLEEIYTKADKIASEEKKKLDEAEILRKAEEIKNKKV